jgi:hypothetical protein
MIATGIQATGGMGLNISTIGKIILKEVRCIAINKPSGTARICATTKPIKILRMLKVQASKYTDENINSFVTDKTLLIDGKFSSNGIPKSLAYSQIIP